MKETHFTKNRTTLLKAFSFFTVRKAESTHIYPHQQELYDRTRTVTAERKITFYNEGDISRQSQTTCFKTAQERPLKATSHYGNSAEVTIVSFCSERSDSRFNSIKMTV
jgi:hypothetical protein